MKIIFMIKIFILFIAFVFISIGLFSQNVGIGTTTPVSKLHIKGAADVTQLIIDANSTQTNINPLFKLRSSAGTDLLWIHSDNVNNTFIGLNAGRVNNVAGGGIFNTFIGRDAGYSNTAGDNNTAIGWNSLSSNTTGFSNTASGSDALSSNITGSRNTANGYAALNSNTTGFRNTANGFAALFGNTTGNYNTANGLQALNSNTTGNYNTALGTNALYNNVAGNNATAIGAGAMYYANNSTTPFTNYNVAVGYEALRGSINPANNSGFGNSALGYQSLLNNSTGYHNTANGFLALYSNTDGFTNTATGSYSLYINTSGVGNTAHGNNALSSNITGSRNTAIGYMADVVSGNLINATAIGYEAKVATSNSLVLGGTGLNAVNVGIGTTAPTHRLQVVGSNNTLLLEGTGSLGSQARLTFGDFGGAYIEEDSDDNLTIYTAGRTSFMWGKVGIGTMSPETNLHIKGISNASQLTIDANTTQSNTSPIMRLRNSSGADLLWLHSDNETNTFLGINAGRSNNAGGGGTSNTFLGRNAGYTNTTGDLNTTTGVNALFNNTTGSQNTAFGYNTLGANISGDKNTGLGHNANVVNGFVVNATVIGANAMASANNSLVLGSINGINAATADVNVGIGTTAPSHRLNIKANSVHAGLAHILLEESENDYTRVRFQNTVASRYWEIGSLPQTINTNAFMNFYYNDAPGSGIVLSLIGNGNATLLGTLSQLSDNRLKTNIEQISNPLKKIMRLNGYHYHWVSAQQDQSLQTGLLAQEVETVFPELVKENETGMKSVNYSGLIPVLIEAIKVQQHQIETLEKRLTQLERKRN